MGADITGAPEPVRPINRRPKGKRGDRADARDAHQSPARLLLADDSEDLLRQTGEFAQHGGEDRQQWRDERHYEDIATRPVP